MFHSIYSWMSYEPLRLPCHSTFRYFMFHTGRWQKKKNCLHHRNIESFISVKENLFHRSISYSAILFGGSNTLSVFVYFYHWLLSDIGNTKVVKLLTCKWNTPRCVVHMFLLPAGPNPSNAWVLFFPPHALYVLSIMKKKIQFLILCMVNMLVFL